MLGDNAPEDGRSEVQLVPVLVKIPSPGLSPPSTQDSTGTVVPYLHKGQLERKENTHGGLSFRGAMEAGRLEVTGSDTRAGCGMCH